MLALAAVYLAGVWLEGVGSNIPSAVFPRTAVYFFQIAALFPRAAVNVIDYRAEGWVCSERRWRELDTRAYFPLDPDDKENRFQRLMHFFRESRPVMQALDAYVVSEHAHPSTAVDDGIPHSEALGGIRVLSLRLPIPTPGGPVERRTRLPLSTYPDSVRKHFYRTPRPKRADRCGTQGVRPAAGEGGQPGGPSDAPDDRGAEVPE